MRTRGSLRVSSSPARWMPGRAGERTHVRSCMRVMHADARLSLSDLLSPLPHLGPPVLTCVFAESWVMETLKFFMSLVMLFTYCYVIYLFMLHFMFISSESWVMETLKLGIKAVGVGKAHILKSQFSLFIVCMIY